MHVLCLQGSSNPQPQRRSACKESVHASNSGNPSPSPPSPPSLPHAPPSTNLHDNLDTALQDPIGEYNHEYFDSQEYFEEGRRKSVCEELSEDSFDEGSYNFEEERTLEELWWPLDNTYNVQTFNSRYRKRRREDRDLEGSREE